MPNNPLATLASNLSRVASHEAACVKFADDETNTLLAQVDREWRVMVKDVLFEYYGGVNTPARRAAYVGRRVAEVRRGCTPYLHRPEYRALAEALDAVAFEVEG